MVTGMLLRATCTTIANIRSGLVIRAKDFLEIVHERNSFRPIAFSAASMTLVPLAISDGLVSVIPWPSNIALINHFWLSGIALSSRALLISMTLYFHTVSCTQQSKGKCRSPHQ